MVAGQGGSAPLRPPAGQIDRVQSTYMLKTPRVACHDLPTADAPAIPTAARAGGRAVLLGIDLHHFFSGHLCPVLTKRPRSGSHSWASGFILATEGSLRIGSFAPSKIVLIP